MGRYAGPACGLRAVHRRCRPALLSRARVCLTLRKRRSTTCEDTRGAVSHLGQGAVHGGRREELYVWVDVVAPLAARPVEPAGDARLQGHVVPRLQRGDTRAHLHHRAWWSHQYLRTSTSGQSGGRLHTARSRAGARRWEQSQAGHSPLLSWPMTILSSTT